MLPASQRAAWLAHTMTSSSAPNVLVPAPNLGTAEPPLAIICHLRSGNVSVNPLPENTTLTPQDLSEYRLTVPVTTVRRKSATTSEDDMWRALATKNGQNHKEESQAVQRQGFCTEAWRIQNPTMVEEVLEVEQKLQTASGARIKTPISRYSPPKIVKPKKATQSAKKKAFTPKAFTLGGRRIEPVHSDEEWFLERLLRIFALIAFIMTLPFSLLFCFKVSRFIVYLLNLNSRYFKPVTLTTADEYQSRKVVRVE